MTNTIGRLRTMGIAAQPTFGSAVTISTYVLPLQNAPTFQLNVNKLMNQSALGSAYMTNDIENGYRSTEVPVEVKVDEDQLPLFLKQRFDITSVTASGETAVYDHTLAYQNDTNTWYSLIFEDENRTSYVIRDVLFSDMNFTLDGDFVRFSATATGAAPVTATVDNTVTQPKEFVGRMVTFKINDDGSTVTATKALSIAASFTFGTNSEGTRFSLGSEDLDTHVLTSDEFSVAVTGNMLDRTNYDDYVSNQAKQFEIDVESTDRFVTGSTSNTRPAIIMNFPYAKISEYSEDAQLDDLVQETYTLMPLARVGESDAPMSWTITNSVASY